MPDLLASIGPPYISASPFEYYPLNSDGGFIGQLPCESLIKCLFGEFKQAPMLTNRECHSVQEFQSHVGPADERGYHAKAEESGNGPKDVLS
jgi:hypothetical protein